MRHNLFLLLLFSLLFFVSCSDDKEESHLEVSKTSIKVGAEASTETFSLVANGDWRITASDGWCTVLPASGKSGETLVTVSFQENLSGKKRTASLLVATGDKNAKIAIEQGLQEVLILPAKNYTVEKEGTLVTIVADQKYQAVVPPNVSWLSFEDVSGTLQMTVKENKTSEMRICKVTFRNSATGGTLETLIVQKGIVASADLLQLTSMKIDDIPCIFDEGNRQFYFPVDMEQASPVLTHKLDFAGLGIEYVKLKGTDKKIYSGETVRFSDFTAKSKIELVAGNTLLDDEKNMVLNITGLPIVSINAPDGIVDEPKRPCDMIIIDPKGRTNGNQVYYETHAGIEWRGSGALRYVKKAYGFKLREDGTTTSKDASLLGLRNDNNWILDAMWLDKARMRNRVCFDLWNEFSKPYYQADEPKATNGTHGHLVEVFLDGRYHGLYVLSDKLDRKQLKLKKEGGYLYKLGDWTDECMLRGITSPYNNNKLVWNGVEMDYPDEEGKIEFKYYSNLIDFVVNSSKEDFSAQFEERIDINNMIDCFLFTNLIVAYDNIGRNTFWGIYDVKKSEKMIPLIWDLDGTLGRTWDRQKEDPNNGWLINSRHHGHDYRIYKRIVEENPANIHAKIKSRWNEIKNTALSTENMNKKLEYYGRQQVDSGAERREIERWSGSAEYDYSDVMSEVAYIKDWYAKRWAKIDKLVQEL